MIPAHLPDRLTIALWDFSWYTRTGPGDVVHDLDSACADVVPRGEDPVLGLRPYLEDGNRRWRSGCRRRVDRWRLEATVMPLRAQFRGE